MRGGAADLGLTAAPADDLRSVFVLNDEFVAVLPRGHRLDTSGGLTFTTLAEQPFIMSGAGCEPMIRSFFAEAGRSPHVAFTVRDMATLFEMVRQRHGVTVVPTMSLPDNRSGLRIAPLSPSHKRTLQAVMKADEAPLPVAEAFLQVLHPATSPNSRNKRERASGKAR